MKLFMMPLMIALGFSTVANAKELPGKVSELALHRIEKLVILKKIEKTFLTDLKTVDFKNLTQSNPSDPAFQVTGSQVPGQDGTQKKIELNMDENGKTLSYNVLTGAVAKDPPQWPDKDALSLMEVGLHCVQGETIGTSTACANITELQRFNESLLQQDLSPIVDAQNKITGATVLLTRSIDTVTAKIFLNTDGTLQGDTPIIIESAETP